MQEKVLIGKVKSTISKYVPGGNGNTAKFILNCSPIGSIIIQCAALRVLVNS